MAALLVQAGATLHWTALEPRAVALARWTTGCGRSSATPARDRKASREGHRPNDGRPTQRETE
jgi:hypothetical protein